MAKKTQTTGNETATAAGGQTPKKARTPRVIQPELLAEIEASKKRISTLKTLNRLLPMLERLDGDGQEQVAKWLEAQKKARAVEGKSEDFQS